MHEATLRQWHARCSSSAQHVVELTFLEETMKTRTLLGAACACLSIISTAASKPISPSALDALPLAFEAEEGGIK